MMQRTTTINKATIALTVCVMDALSDAESENRVYEISVSHNHLEKSQRTILSAALEDYAEAHATELFETDVTFFFKTESITKAVLMQTLRGLKEDELNTYFNVSIERSTLDTLTRPASLTHLHEIAEQTRERRRSSLSLSGIFSPPITPGPERARSVSPRTTGADLPTPPALVFRSASDGRPVREAVPSSCPTPSKAFTLG